MSLMNLLAVGRSFAGAGNQQGRYKIQGNMLPKFAPVGRPVSLAPAPRPAVSAERNLFEAKKGASGAPAGAWVPDPAPVQPLPNPVSPFVKKGAVSAVVSPVFHQAAAATAAPAVGRRGFLRNPFARPSTTPVSLVQAELSLDAVRVVRNDLFEADLEVVRKRRERASDSAGAAASGTADSVQGAVGGGPRSFLRRLFSRWIRARAVGGV